MSKDKMEDRIIAYLLGECDEEEAFEVEKLCREDSKWQAEKIRYGQVLGLLEESINQTAPEFLPEKELKLKEEQRKEIKSLLEKDSEISKVREDEVIVDENKNDRKEDGMTEKENKDNKSKMIYWAPLAAAAMAAIIAYCGNPEKEAEKTFEEFILWTKRVVYATIFGILVVVVGCNSGVDGTQGGYNGEQYNPSNLSVK